MWTKLGELKGKRVLTFPTEVIDSIKEIAKDPDASDIFLPKAKPDDVDAMEWAISRMNKSKLALLQRHPEELATILAANAGMSVEEWEEQIDMDTYEVDMMQMMSDPHMRSFFASAQTMMTSL